MRAMFPTLVALLLGLPAPHAQAPTADRQAGHVVLLALAPPEEALPPLAAALRDPDPAMRTAAARVLAARTDLNPVPALIETLAAEQHEAAAAEQVRALLMNSGEAVRDVVEPHAKRIGGAAAVTLLGWIARHQPGEFPGRLATLAAVVPPEDTTLTSIVIRAARNVDVRDAILRAWMPHAGAGRWKPVLDAVLLEDSDLQRAAPALVEGLSSSQAAIRDDTVWFVVNALGKGLELTEAVVRAAVPTDETPATLDWERFGRELIARRLLDASLPDRANWLEASGGNTRRLRPTAAPLLSRRERNALKLNGDRAPSYRTSGLPAGQHAARTIVEWMPGVVSMTAAAAGCPLPGVPAAGYARLTYDSSGRVRHLAVDHRQLPPECQPVLAALARTGFADFTVDIGSSDQQWHLLPLSKGFAECTSRPSAPTFLVGEEYYGQKITTPRKVKDVRPEYPAEMLSKGVQGLTIIEAVIADTGCVHRLEVLRSSGAHLLDLAALLAVSGWTFEPTRVDGRAVPVRMTVTVNFSVGR